MRLTTPKTQFSYDYTSSYESFLDNSTQIRSIWNCFGRTKNTKGQIGGDNA